MKIDNQKNTYRIWLSRLIMTVAFALIIVVLIFIPWFDNPDSQFSKYHVIILISAIYVGINVIKGLKKPDTSCRAQSWGHVKPQRPPVRGWAMVLSGFQRPPVKTYLSSEGPDQRNGRRCIRPETPCLGPESC